MSFLKEKNQLCICVFSGLFFWASQVVLLVKNLPANAGDTGTQVWFLGQEDPLEEEMAPHSSILAWKIPWTVEPGGLQSMGSQRVGHHWAQGWFCSGSKAALWWRKWNKIVRIEDRALSQVAIALILPGSAASGYDLRPALDWLLIACNKEQLRLYLSQGRKVKAGGGSEVLGKVCLILNFLNYNAKEENHFLWV